LFEADVGIVLNNSQPAVAAAVLIPEQGLEKLGTLFKLSLICQSKIRQNLLLMRTANSLGLYLGAVRRLTPQLAAMYNSAVTLAVGLNTLFFVKRNGFYRNSGPKCGKKEQRPITDRRTEAGDTPEKAPKPLLTLVKKNGDPPSAPEAALAPGKPACGNGWPRLTAGEALLKLGSDQLKGLTGDEVAKRLLTYGYNKLAESKRPGMFSRFINQLNNFMVQALLGSTVVCFFLGEISDALAILAIVIMNAIFGMLQEQKAENALAALKQMTAPGARVLREGQMIQIPAAELVPGDIVFLEQGDVVPADMRLLTVNSFEVEESSPTGEPCPVGKKTAVQKHYDLIHECVNMAFMGTTVTRGRAVGVVVATGMNTEMGGIAGLLAADDNETTPPQRRLEAISKSVLKACLTVSGVVVLAGILRGQPPFAMFLTGVSLAVAAIPEGLPATVTVALAAGVRRLAREHAIVRRLPGVETLGCASVICTDKTGALTKNQLTV